MEKEMKKIRILSSVGLRGSTTSKSNVVERQAGDTITGISISVVVWQGVD